tara:strand:- start:326 stop:529 length:204 start_codon:yes stop_codon:yes gene_type:complete
MAQKICLLRLKSWHAFCDQIKKENYSKKYFQVRIHIAKSVPVGKKEKDNLFSGEFSPPLLPFPYWNY